MIHITYPDNSVHQFAVGATPYDVSLSISKSLAKKAILAKINGELWDMHRPITDSSSIELLTRDDDDALDVIRHDCAHILAEAVQELFPNVNITFGPSTDDGFYYDFYREESFSTDDFEAIEQKMHDIIDRDSSFIRHVKTRDELITMFSDMGETFKVEHIKTLAADEELTLYTQGDWVDLCRGPHLPSTKHIGKAFKLMKLSGTYWRADANNQKLQRIYGTCWRNEKELTAYINRLEEAQKRDHRRLGKQLDYFHFQDEAPGSVFWHDKGWRLYTIIEHYMRQCLNEADYQEVKTPQLVDRALWEASGHWDKFRENMFIAEVDEHHHDHNHSHDDEHHHAKETKDSVYALKPMNCPCHVQIFKQGIKSYRDLPLRMAEFGSCHRFEPSGALHGLMRVRAFTQDDAHIFCTTEQIVDECKIFCDLLLSIYKDFGFEDVHIKFSDRPEKRAGSDHIWDMAEHALRQSIEEAGIEYTLNPGEGAFYGPKLEYVLRDAIGRDWQCGTFQVDFVLPERLDAHYIAEDGSKQRPVMLHRAILGSFERFIGIVLENFAGRLPLWLAPEQVVIATITSEVDDYAEHVENMCKKAGLRVRKDVRNEKINYKIREISQQLIPAIFVIGHKEKASGEVAIRRLGGTHQNIVPLDKAIEMLTNEAINKQ